MMVTTLQAECWGLFELNWDGPRDGNPFIDVELSARFQYKNRVLEVQGFYDGDGVYRVRFMPDAVGAWRYETYSNRPELNAIAGTLICTEPGAGNHGPVGVHNTYHFAYRDKT